MSERPAGKPGSRAWYLYGITTTSTALPGAPAAGIDGAPLRAIDAGHLRGVTSQTDAGVFSDDALDRERADPGDLERKIRDHDEVLRALAADSPLIPLRFGTVVAGEADVRVLLERHRDAFRRTLARLDAAAEWGVKGYWDRSALHAHTAAEGAGGARDAEATRGPDPSGPAVGEGTAYLRGKRREREDVQEAQRVRDTVLASCHHLLSARAREAALLPLRKAAPEPDERALVLNASYLVAADRVGGFRAAVAELSEAHAGAGLSLVLTGPWPPYSFVGPGALAAGAPEG